MVLSPVVPVLWPVLSSSGIYYRGLRIYRRIVWYCMHVCVCCHGSMPLSATFSVITTLVQLCCMESDCAKKTTKKTKNEAEKSGTLRGGMDGFILLRPH